MGGQRGRKPTDVFDVEAALVVEGGVILRAELQSVIRPDARVVLVEEALVGRVGAVVRTLAPSLKRVMGGSVSGGKRQDAV